MSKTRMIRSTPAVAITESRYLFQSCVSISLGSVEAPVRGTPGRGGVPCAGMRWTRWLEAEAGTRRSKIRRWESEDTEEMMEVEWGDQAVL